MQLCIFEDETVYDLKPMTSTRAVYDLRLAHRTLLDRLQTVFEASSLSLHVRKNLARVSSLRHPEAVVNTLNTSDQGTLFVNGRFLALDEDLIARIQTAVRNESPGVIFLKDETVVAAWIPDPHIERLSGEPFDRSTFGEVEERPADSARLVERLWQLIELLPEILVTDGRRLLREHGARTPGNSLRDRGVIFHRSGQIHCAESAAIKPGALLNAEYGPIVIDDHAVVMERAVIRGPAYVGPHSQIKPAARIECSALGPHVKIGGEVEQAIVHSYSNKMHDGFMGHSYIGQWCNLAADTNTSTLKNDYSTSSLYNYRLHGFESTDQEFLGLFMGDYSKCGINTMFNPGSVVGVSCNLFGAGYMPRFIPSFSWGGGTEFAPYGIKKALEVAEATMTRRDHTLSPVERDLLQAIHAEVHGRDERAR
jgi:UDP-N-acetylglucosamine diphosphorylase/glucosamine-1-phosphate N-acetyltransferase